MDELCVLAGSAVKKLREKKVTLSSAESITGGMFAKYITDVPGASSVLDRSIVTYSNKAKSDELGIDLAEIDRYGAVSSQVAELMATGLGRKTSSEICISVTGCAGPGPDDRGVPAGTFYIGLCVNKCCRVVKFELGEIGRDAVRKAACREMLSRIIYAAENELTEM